MSLICCECRGLMGPSSTLPGREATLVYPIVLGKVWRDGTWVLTYVKTVQNQCVCFKCIQTKVPDSRKYLMADIYSAYVAEADYRELEKELKGQWLELHDPRSTKKSEAFNQYDNFVDKLNLELCLICGENVRQAMLPYFHALGLDKIYCQESISGLFGEQNYSFSHLECGLVSFVICFNCFLEKFPKTHKQLSCDLRGVQNIEDTGTNELLISTDFLDALVMEIGNEQVDKQMEELSQHTQIKIME